MTDTPSFFQSKTFKGILFGLGIAIILLITFQAGVMFGYRKANFSYKYAENYPGNFFPGGPKPHGDFFREMNNQYALKGHGAVGEIIKIDKSVLTVKGKDEAEKPVLIKTDTVFERGFETIKVTDLKVGDQIIVVGSPNDSGQVEAKIIRILPNPLSFMPFHKSI